MSPGEEKKPTETRTAESESIRSPAAESGKDGDAAPARPASPAISPSRLVGVLTAVCIGAGVALAGGHAATNGQIARQRYRFKLASVKKVLPGCDNDPGKDTVEVKLPGGKSTTVYRCRIGGKVAAVAYSLNSEANKNAPYSGTIEVLVGVETANGNIVHDKSEKRVGVLILKHSETPGLGAKIEEYNFLRQYGDHVLNREGRSCPVPNRCRNWAVLKDDAAGIVDAISGATISSRAVTEMVKRALEHYNDPEIRSGMTRASVAGKEDARPAPPP